MIGAIIGDIAGSRFEGNPIKSKRFDLFHPSCRVTDDSVMSLAIAKAVLHSDKKREILSAYAVKFMQELGRRYARAGYGGRFREWLQEEDPQPYGSYGNGAAMRVSACGFAADSLEEAIALSHAVTAVTHDHPEGIKGAESVAVAVYLARTGCRMEDIRQHIARHYYSVDFRLDDIREEYRFDVTCQGSVPYAFAAFFESTDFEDAIRNAVSIGGDSDTIAAITGSMAEAYYGVPDKLREQAQPYIGTTLQHILVAFEEKYPPKSESCRNSPDTL